MAKREWQPVVDEMSNVQTLVHLAARYDSYDQERIKSDLLRAGRRAYESELAVFARRMGCPGRSGQLQNGPFLSELNEVYEEHAASIVNTYNYDLAAQINVIRADAPRANRHVYAKRIRDWDEMRDEFKQPQINQMTESVARARAQQHFHVMNNLHDAVAVLEPTTAVCPVCQGWIERGEVPIHEAMNHPPPYHPSCPHAWKLRRKGKLNPDECELLWMGE